MASRASFASNPSAERRTVLPMPAPSIINPMIERAETDWPSLATSTLAENCSAERHQLGGGTGVQAAAVDDGDIGADLPRVHFCAHYSAARQAGERS